MTAGGAPQPAALVRFLLNPHATRRPYGGPEADIVSLASARRAMHEMHTWPGYAVSPLRDLRSMARRLGVASVWCKDETQRFGLGSFKALGGAYAAGLALDRKAATGGSGSSSAEPTLCCATDGNHGRSVARGARRHGCRCVIFVHEHALESKLEPMRRLGAEVIRVPGNYDDSVRHARRMADDHGWTLISDTSDDAADAVVADVMRGYGIMLLEADEQLKGSRPTHVFVQAGVGGLAAAVAGCFAESAGSERPKVIVVEPEAAACVMQSALHESPAALTGDLLTNMAMLSCGETSAPAWVILKYRADAFMTVSDAAADAAADAMRASPDVPGGLAATPSAAAGLAGAMAAAQDASIAAQLGLGRDSGVMIFATEGVDERPDTGG